MPSAVWFAPWKSGPAGAGLDDDAGDAGAGGGPGVVSVTEFVPHRPWDALGVGIAGAALRRIWHDVEGAVGLWLWTVPDLLRPRSGAVSVWRDETCLAGFVSRPDHLRIVRAYRDRGTLRSAMWRTEDFDRAATREAARALLTGRTDWPAR
ncbi:hypothetical protein ACF061_28550 [Streptomyces sp. NPDC015220]|uniref:hypothetical protein n=1 Tax=Streptomyces sp. NPDC015220 TaxID=3364947 RepID=UPI0036FA9FDA